MSTEKLNKESREAVNRYQALLYEQRWHRVPGGWVYADGNAVYRVEGTTRSDLQHERKKAYRHAIACLNATKETA